MTGGDRAAVLAERFIPDVVQSSASTGFDRAVVQDDTSSRIDTFGGRASVASLSGAGYSLNMFGFDRVVATSLGGNDVVRLFGTPGTDAYHGTPTNSTFSTAGTDFHLANFRFVVARGEGGVDHTTLFGSAGDDVFTATPTTAFMTGSGFALNALEFDVITGAASGVGVVAGGTDRAFLIGSPGNDAFTGAGMFGHLHDLTPNTLDYALYTTGFARLEITGLGGINRRLLNGFTPQIAFIDTWV